MPPPVHLVRLLLLCPVLPACNPQKTPAAALSHSSEGHSSEGHSSEGHSSEGLSSEPLAASQTPPKQSAREGSNDASLIIDRSVCGLPEKIREEDWPRTLAPTEQRPPHAPSPGAFSIAVLPDTQYYVSCRERHLGVQTRWLAENFDDQKVVATIQLGDLTEHNTADEWVFVSDALKPLGEKAPMFVASGNHDYGVDGSANIRQTLFAEYFGAPSPGRQRWSPNK